MRVPTETLTMTAAGPRVAVVPDDVAVDRLTELLVARDRDAAWWRRLAACVDGVAAAVAAHGTDPDAYCRPCRPGGAPHPVQRVLHEDHARIADELAALRAALHHAETTPGGTTAVLAGCTQVIALVRDHGRRARRAALPPI